MASTFFKQFAIENNLTVDYGYTFGKYKGTYIFIKESLGSSKSLWIITDIASRLDELKQVLSVFTEETLPLYCISNMVREKYYIKLTFELVSDKNKLLIDFIDKFIESANSLNISIKPVCPICGKVLDDNDTISLVDIGGTLSPTHSKCYEDQIKEKAKPKDKTKKETSEESSGSSYLAGLLGSIVYALIYMAILIVSFVFIQFIQSNTAENGIMQILQYLPTLLCLSSCPLIYSGYEKFHGKRGTSKYLIILWTVIISTLIGVFCGFALSFTFYYEGTVIGLFKTIIQILGGEFKAFKYGFYVYMVLALALACLSMVFKFSGNKESSEANKETFEKLE